jgi:4'-phosphopantetheinyl transferase EntD
VAAFAHPGRRTQWLTARAALRAVLAATGRPTDSTAYAFPHPHVSLSHCRLGSAATAAEGTPDRVAGVGIDLEPVRPVRPGAVRFFLTPAERPWLEAVPAAEHEVELIRLWTVKEAVFKADPANEGATTYGEYHLDDPAATAGTARRPGSPFTFTYVTTVTPPLSETIAVALRPI